jgi:NTE family protein
MYRTHVQSIRGVGTIEEAVLEPIRTADAAAAILAGVHAFGEVDEHAITEFAARAEMRDLGSGQVLYTIGEDSNEVYVVVSGRLRVTSGERVVGYVGRMQPVGEMGAVTCEPRTATVAAVRDSVVLRFAREDFLAFLHEHPDAMLTLSRLMIARLREQGRTRLQSATELQGTFAVIPASAEVPVRVLAEALVRRLGGWPQARLISAAHVDAALGEGASQAPLTGDASRLKSWLGELEGRHRYIVYAADSDRDAWALRCLHSADRVLVLAEASQSPAAVPVVQELHDGGLLAAIELVLLRPEGDPSPYTLEWREAIGARSHYFVHPWDEAELTSLSRQVTGRGVGVVLGGGGARGFAHIGLVRALRELQIAVDVVGGASIGAFLAALIACGLDSVEMTRVARDTFVRSNFLNDYAIPRYSLIRGRKFAARLQEIFGDDRIENLRRPFFCVSTNLTTGLPMIHDRGPLAVWVGTSMAVPGVGPPVAYEGELLCDGGVADNLPTDVMQSLERGSIIASNVSTEGDIRAPGHGVGDPDPEALMRWAGDGAPPRLGAILMRSATLTGALGMARAAELADVYLDMPCDGIGLFEWKRLDELVERGYEYAVEALAPVRDTLVAR